MTGLSRGPTFSKDLLTGASDPDQDTLLVQGLDAAATTSGGRTLAIGADYTLSGSTLALTAAGFAKFNSLSATQSEQAVIHFDVSDSVVATPNTLTLTINGLNDPAVINSVQSTLGGAISELPNVTGNSAVDSTQGLIAFSDPDLNDRPTPTINTAGQTATWQDGSGHVFALSAAQIAMFDQAIQIIPEAGNTNTGKIGWSYGLVDKLIDFLGVGETVTVTTPVIIDDHQGGVITQDVVVTVNGANDNPIATADSNGIAKGSNLSIAPSAGVLANDIDPDVHDQGHLFVSAVNGSAGGVGHVVQGTYGSLALNADGSYVYDANKGALPSQIVAPGHVQLHGLGRTRRDGHIEI